jgi:murein DD-endopeptidase MepM/ murein hydrolase activator NlpD
VYLQRSNVKRFILLLTVLLCLWTVPRLSTGSISYTVYAMEGNPRFIKIGGDQLGIGLQDQFGDGVMLRTSRESSVSFSAAGNRYHVYPSSLVRIESEPRLVYGKLSKSSSDRGPFVDLHFYYIPTPAQGRTMKLIVRSRTGDIRVRSSLKRDGGRVRELKMYQIEEGKYRALTGFDCEAPAVRYRIIIRAEKESAGFTQVVYPFYLQETSFSRGRVDLSSEKQELFEPSDRKAREVRHLSMILSRPDPRALWIGRFSHPLQDPTVISSFGKRRSYFMDGAWLRVRHHRGIDYKAARGTPVYAPNRGVVVLTASRITTGNTLVLDHGQGVFSLFFHLDSISASAVEGQEVEKGEKVAEAGSTGIAAGAHLHWGLFVDGTYVNPEDWIKRSF